MYSNLERSQHNHHEQQTDKQSNLNNTPQTSSESNNATTPTGGLFDKEEFFNLMKYERLRLITYILYGHQWPLIDQVSPAKLAKAGFFYLKENQVQCAFCRGILKDWSKGDIPMEEHRKHFPNCVLVNDGVSGNIPLGMDAKLNNFENQANQNPFLEDNPGQEQIFINYNKTIEPKYPKFSDPAKRAATFNHKNWSTNISSKKFLDKNKFIEAGFFYSGKADKTFCYHCGAIFFGWKPEENPYEEHSFFAPECHFIIATKGKDYLEFVKFKKNIIEMRNKIPARNKTEEWTKAKDINCMRKISFENFQKMKQSALKLSKKLNENSTTDSELDDNEKYFQDYCQRSLFFIDCQNLFQSLIAMHCMKPIIINNSQQQNADLVSSDDDESTPQTSSSVNYNQSSPTTSSLFSLTSLPFESSDSDYSSCNSDSEDANTNSNTEDKNSKNKISNKKSSLTCIICCDRQIEIVFLPCGHQLSCMKCSLNLNQCPVCRQLVTSKIRTYFAYLE